MDTKQKTLEELSAHASEASSLHTLVGLDGFVDKLMTPVDKRTGRGMAFSPIETIEDFGNRMLGAAGKSTNVEMYPKKEKLGGNGPIMANALLAAGTKARYIGALGHPTVDPVFEEFARKTEAISIGNPGVTHALEFRDGKIMLGNTSPLDAIDYDAIIGAMGEGKFWDLLSRCRLVALVNWTMIPQMTSIMQAILERALPMIPPMDGGRHFFFDLTDPEKRSDGDLSAVLKTITRYMSHGPVTLGLNLKEAQQVDRILGNSPVEPDEDGLKRMASRIRSALEITTVVVHPTSSAAGARKDGSWWVKGPYCENPVTTTGAGDHFNAGFSLAQTLGMSPECCLTVAVAFSGQYVRTGESPSLAQTDTFIRSWESTS